MSGQDEILRRLQDSMPQELSRHPNALITKLLRGLAKPIGSFLDDATLALGRECIPDKAVELLDAWEDMCKPYDDGSTPSAVVDRQDALRAKFRDRGDARREGFRLFAVGLGYADAVVTDYDLALCTGDCTQAVFGPAWLFAFKITATSLGAQRDAVLQAMVSRRVQSGCFVHCIFV
jgi:uncharacterized protein YmfQ (DUF2313 family)